jgi:hypothetical protein
MKKSHVFRRILVILLALVALVSVSFLCSYRLKYDTLMERLTEEQTHRAIDTRMMLTTEGDDAYVQYLQFLAQYEEVTDVTENDIGLLTCFNYFTDKDFYDDTLEFRTQIAKRIADLGDPIPTDETSQATLLEIVNEVADEYAQWQEQQSAETE